MEEFISLDLPYILGGLLTCILMCTIEDILLPSNAIIIMTPMLLAGVYYIIFARKLMDKL